MHRRDLLQRLATCVAAGASTSCSIPIVTPQSSGISLGIDQLARGGFSPLKGRRVGFITNQTSVNGAGIMSRLVLQQGLGRDLKALFGPEHGLDTRAKAGDHVANGVDSVTGLRAFSLYGQNRKPTPQMLADLDVLVFDIQDIGVRSYTYISTMALAMEACGEAGKEFVVLDRPNPLGGKIVEGPPMEAAFRSFVGQVPVPYRHGLTIGELAKLIVAKNWMKANPRLTVIPMQGWHRMMNWADTKLNWIPTSPNIPNWDSPFYCATTGILGELQNVDIGIGTDKPFHYAAAQGINGTDFAQFLNALDFPGFSFKPYQSVVKPGFSGVEVTIDPTKEEGLMEMALILIEEVCKRTNGDVLNSSGVNAQDLFKKVYGSEALGNALQNSKPTRELVESWGDPVRASQWDRMDVLLYHGPT